MRKEVEKVIDEIRPILQADGGDVELIDVEEQTGIVRVRLTGACAGCPHSQMTVKMVVEQLLKKKVPTVKRVESA